MLALILADGRVWRVQRFTSEGASTPPTSPKTWDSAACAESFGSGNLFAREDRWQAIEKHAMTRSACGATVISHRCPVNAVPMMTRHMASYVCAHL
jgi:hypothetical protein